METHVTPPVPVAVTVNDIGGAAGQAPSQTFQVAVEESEGRRRTVFMQQNPGLTTTVIVGSLGAFVTEPGTKALLNVTDVGQYIEYTASGVNEDIGWLGSLNVTRRGYNPTFYAVLRVGGSIAAARFAIGIGAAGAMGGANLWDLINCMAFRYDTDVDGGALWRAVTSNAGGAGTATVTTTAATIAINTSYRLKIVVGAADVKYYIDDVLVATHATTIPASTVDLGVSAALRSIGSSGRVLSLSRLLWSQKEL